MFIGSIVFDLYIPYARSLKDKRTVIRSFKEKLRSKFNVSVSEVGNNDKWQNSQIAVVLVASDKKHLEKQIDTIISFIEINYPDIHLNIYREII